MMSRKLFSLMLTLLIAGGAIAAGHTRKVLPSGSSPYGQTYGEWSAAWWKWAMEFPLDGPAPHPFLDDPSFDVSAGQAGSVWFLAAPLPGTFERTCTIPSGKALFVGMVTNEASDLEGLGSTEAEQRATADYFADHIVDSFFTIDGVPVANIDSYRVASPQFTFTAPTPWFFGPTGGAGTAVADGYYVMIPPLPPGQHTLHYGGAFHFSIAEGDPFDLDLPLDMTYHLTVQ